MKPCSSCFASVLILFTASICSVCAWWDEGHLLLAAVARLQLSDAEVEALEAPLKQWEPQYPGLSSIVTVAVWPDKIKCGHNTSYCDGLLKFDALEIFNSWHYTSHIYNPQNIELDDLQQYLPLPETGAVWALEKLLEGLPGLPRAADNSYLPGDFANLQFPYLASDSHEAPASSAPHPRSAFSWNFRLRMLIHIFGDIHQPLHSIEMFSRQYRKGDNGGNSVQVDVSDSRLIPAETEIDNLHNLWDSCVGQLANPFPTDTESEILKKAAKLVSQYPPSSFGSRLKTSRFDHVVQETFKIAQDSVYGEMDWSSDLPHGRGPYRPSEEYLKTAQSVCLQQIALGGYRLAVILKDLARVLQRTETTFPASLSSAPVRRDFVEASPHVAAPKSKSIERHEELRLAPGVTTPAHRDGKTNAIIVLGAVIMECVCLWHKLIILALAGTSAFACWKWTKLSRGKKEMGSQNASLISSDN